jgi:hypothetical protein
MAEQCVPCALSSAHEQFEPSVHVATLLERRPVSSACAYTPVSMTNTCATAPPAQGE